MHIRLLVYSWIW